ncbi:MAG: sodium:calcium antiporter [Chloroflexi bacterium]|nr:sodium:calcium antiporter [Chloroflexota bacterium]
MRLAVGMFPAAAITSKRGLAAFLFCQGGMYMVIQLVNTLSFPVAIIAGIVGLVLMVLAANLAVKKMVELAEYLKLSATFMGMTVLSLATSIPEITSHVTASASILSGNLDYKVGSAIVLGSNIGSDVVQQTLIMGVVVLITGSLYFRRYFLWKSMIPMIGSTLLCIVLGMDGTYSRLDGAILFGSFIAYTYYLYVDERKYYGTGDAPTQEQAAQPAINTAGQAWMAALIGLASMVITVLAAQIVLGVTERIVTVTGIGGSLLGVVTLGVASALPEFTTALAGARNNAHGISLGTLVGSNITNPLVAIGLGALISTYAVPRPLIAWDLPWEAVTGAILLVYLLLRKGKIGRKGSIYFIALYVIYILVRVFLFAAD